MIRRIILDVDDVLNSLTLHILRHYKCNIGPFDYFAFPNEVGYDIIAACQILGGLIPYIKNNSGEFVPDVVSFWNGVTCADLWRTAPKSPQCEWLLDKAVDLVGKDEIYLATSPTKDPQAHADKLHWMWDNLPNWIHRQYFMTPRKWLLGKLGVILFDDNSENCEKFIAEGGDALLVPRPWNSLHKYDTDLVISTRLNELAEEKINVRKI